MPRPSTPAAKRTRCHHGLAPATRSASHPSAAITPTGAVAASAATSLAGRAQTLQALRRARRRCLPIAAAALQTCAVAVVNGVDAWAAGALEGRKHARRGPLL